MDEIPVTLTIAGSDCSSGAGLQADLKTFQHFRCFGLTATTCVVSETPKVVRSVHPVPVDILLDQLTLLLGHYPIAAIKTGMIFSGLHVRAVGEVLASHPTIPVVVDPVMVASTGDPLMRTDAIDSYRNDLLPRAHLITPNLDEAEVLAGYPIRSEEAMEKAALELSNTFDTAILLKGGHLDSDQCGDLLCRSGQQQWFRSPRLATDASHGTGCTLSAAIAANLALKHELPEAVTRAKEFLNQCLAQSLNLGPFAHLNQGTAFE